MHTKAMLTICASVLQIGVAATITLIQRWMLEISTPSKDIAWLKRTKFYAVFVASKWYRGMEYYHQIQAMNIIKGCSF